jgi:hypothetical protein
VTACRADHWHHDHVPSPHPARRSAAGTARRAVAALLVVVAALTLVSGCARVRAALAVQPDDTVRGEIVLATPARSADDPGPPVTIPPGLDVDVSAYRDEDYTGCRLSFSDLTFEDMSLLTSVVGGADQRVQFTLRRVGNRVLAEGAADLATVSANRADFQLKITFPGDILETNGETEGSTVTWTFEPGQKGEIRSVASFVDPDGPSNLLWTGVLTLLVTAAAGAVVWLARHDRNAPASRP